ncbi:MAG TPA: GNAT family N-acetyltransferase [Anaerolineales bacterium]|nr:GNAT family N-acetyltransferase [Anaerolineales bacterium]
MKKYSVRPAVPSDIEAVYRLIEKQNLADYGEAMITIDDLKKSWQSLDFETDTCMAYTDGKLAGYAELHNGDSPYIYLEDRNNVDLGFQLLTILEEEALSRKTEGVRLVTRISEKNKILLELFASNGYKSDLSFLIMELRLGEAPAAPQWPEGINVRTFTPGRDEYAAYQADEEAARDKGYHAPLSFEAWVNRVGLTSERFDPGLWFLAVDGNEIVGLALNIHARETNTGWVDHLGVRPAWRNKGIGKALLLHSFAEFQRRGVQRVKLSVDSRSLTDAPRLYESVGMSTVQQYHIYGKELRP